MNREHAITLTPAEIALHREGRLLWLVRAAELPNADWRVTTREDGFWQVDAPTHGKGVFPCPLGQPGDVLFHQEEWFDNCTSIEDQVIGAPRVYYRAADPEYDQFEGETPVWQPAETMPSWASRYRIPVTSVELVRLQGIPWHEMHRAGFPHSPLKAKDWDEANPDTPWASNPFVWKVGVAQGEGS